MEPIRLIIIDDHPAVRLGLQAVLDKFDDIHVVGVAGGCEQAISLCRREPPDVALVDMFMPDINGIETIRALHAEFPRLAAIMLTHSDRDENIIQAMDAGAIGYLVKDTGIEDIARAVRAAAAGKRTLSPEALEAIIRHKTTPQPHPDNQLTERERQVLHLMVDGLKNPEIAADLTVSLSTVKFHISMIFKKLDVKTRTEAVVKAINTSLVERPNT